MRLKMKGIASVATLLLTFSLLAGCSKPAEPAPAPSAAAPASEAPKEAAKAPLKAALLTSGPINDGGWNTHAYNGLLKCQALGYEIANTENVQQAEMETILRDYAKKGYNLIIGHGFEYGDTLLVVAADYPDIKFLQIGGDAENGTNVGSRIFATGDIAYVIAGIAARSTKTNKVGFVGAMEIPTIAGEVAMFKKVIPMVNPEATVTTAYIGSWTDIAKGKEATLAQINSGCDVIIGIGDACDAGAIQACQENPGTKFIGWAGDFNAMAPDIVLTSGVQDVAGIIEGDAKDILDGKFDSSNKVLGVKEGITVLGTFSDTIDPEVKKIALQEYEDLKAGKITLPEIEY